MVKFSLFLTLVVCGLFGGTLRGYAQQSTANITLEECYQKAIDNSTLSRQNEIQHGVATAKTKDTGSTFLPSAAINGTGSYQSDVVRIPIPTVASPSKWQYKALLDVEQTIYDGGWAKRQKGVITSELDAQTHNLAIDKLALRDRVSTLYLGVVLADANIRILRLHADLLQKNIAQMESRVDGGVADKSAVDILEAELLSVEQQIDGASIERSSVVDMISVLTGSKIDRDVVFTIPVCIEDSFTLNSDRPEFKLFDSKQQALDREIKVISSKNIPKIGAFVSGGNGLPGLNMISRDPQWYYVVGLNFKVPLTAWTSTKHQKQVVSYNKELIDTEREDFTRNNKMEIISQLGQIEKLQQLITKDNQIIEKRSQITLLEEQRLLGGVATPYDYVAELNAEQDSRLRKNVHEVELLQATINYKLLIGKE